jgi:3-hydroxybutyryl-CoA dehydratase
MGSLVAVPAAGEVLDGFEADITADLVEAYADAASDHNPIHLDAEFAATTPFGGPIAHGMLVLAYVSRLLTRRFGAAWLNGGTLEARFRAPAKVGTRVRIGGVVTSVTPGGGATVTACTLQVTDGAGQVLVTATAAITL